MTLWLAWLAAWFIALQVPAPASDPAKRADEGHGRALQQQVNCIECHGALLKGRYVHGPAAGGGCLECHEVARKEDGRVVVRLKAEGTGGCVSCHEDVKSRLGAKHVHAPVVAGACTTCHDAHSAPYRYQLEAEGNAACVLCHEDIRDDLQRGNVHEPAANCGTCHDAHGGPFPWQTRRPLNDLCLDCHAPNPDAGEEPPRSLAATVLRLDADRQRGHPVSGHPVSAPRDPMSPGRPFTCVSCHNPHGAKAKRLLRFGAVSISELCIKCHKW